MFVARSSEKEAIERTIKSAVLAIRRKPNTPPPLSLSLSIYIHRLYIHYTIHAYVSSDILSPPALVCDRLGQVLFSSVIQHQEKKNRKEKEIFSSRFKRVV